VCDKLASEYRSWGTGGQFSDHCNGYPDKIGFYPSLKQRTSFTSLATLSQSQPHAQDTPRPLNLLPATQEVSHQQRGGLPPRQVAQGLHELPAPGGDDMVCLEEFRLPCKVVAQGLTLRELDAKLLRHGAFATTTAHDVWDPALADSKL
jgi:hypothetical protein